MYEIKKTYKDYNGVERTEVFRFNFSEAEVIEMEATTGGGLLDYFQRIVDAKDGKTVMSAFKDLVLKAYGVKSDDGRRFIKTAEVKQEFTELQAYSDIFVELALDDKAGAAFMRGIMPESLADTIKKYLEGRSDAIGEEYRAKLKAIENENKPALTPVN